MSYGSVYIESDINKMKQAGYSKKYIITIISKRIRYRYPSISIKGAKKIALDAYNGKSESSGWKSKSRKATEPTNGLYRFITSPFRITESERKIWRKCDLGSI